MADTDDVVKLYSMLQSLETLRILRTSGSSKGRGTIITVEVSHPTPLTELLANMSELDARDVAGGRDNIVEVQTSFRRRQARSPCQNRRQLPGDRFTTRCAVGNG